MKNPKFVEKNRLSHLGEKHYLYKKTYEEQFGEERAKEIKRKISEGKLGDKNPMYKKEVSNIHRDNMRKAQLRRKERDGYINSPETREKLKDIALKDYRDHPERREQRRKSALEQFKNGMPKETVEKLRIIKTDKKNPKCSETKKRLYMEGKLKIWNKGKRGVMPDPWNKGKSNYEIRGDKNPAKRPEVREKIGVAVTGEKNGQWQGGISFEPYTKEFSNKFKRAIRKRDNQICILCGIHREKLNKALFIHHINYDKELSVAQNCLSLCNSCHTKTNSNRKYWIGFFQGLLSEKYEYKYSESREIILKTE